MLPAAEGFAIRDFRLSTSLVFVLGLRVGVPRGLHGRRNRRASLAASLRSPPGPSEGTLVIDEVARPAPCRISPAGIWTLSFSC